MTFAFKKIPFKKMMRYWKYEKSTGRFRVIRKYSCYSNAVVGDIVGTILPDGRTQLKFEGITYPASRVAWCFYHGRQIPNLVIDHINGNPSDNRIVNLRAVSETVNRNNLRKAQKNSISGFLGVCKKQAING